MKKMFIFGAGFMAMLILASVLTTFVAGCQKDDNLLVRSPKRSKALQNSEIISTSSDSDDQLWLYPNQSNTEWCFGFTNEELDTIGIVHNHYLLEVYQQVDFSACTNCREDIIQAFKEINVDLSGLGISLDSLINFAVAVHDSLESYDIREWNNSPFNQATNGYLVTIMNLIDNASYYQGLADQLDSLQENAAVDSSLNCFDLEVISAAIEVAKKSAYLWMPRSMGGLEINSLNENTNGTRWSWKKAVFADASAAAVYFNTMAAVLAITSIAPPANAVIALEVGIGTALSSALGGL